jgi:hypothetical protein
LKTGELLAAGRAFDRANGDLLDLGIGLFRLLFEPLDLLVLLGNGPFHAGDLRSQDVLLAFQLPTQQLLGSLVPLLNPLGRPGLGLVDGGLQVLCETRHPPAKFGQLLLPRGDVLLQLFLFLLMRLDHRLQSRCRPLNLVNLFQLGFFGVDGAADLVVLADLLF